MTGSDEQKRPPAPRTEQKTVPAFSSAIPWQQTEEVTAERYDEMVLRSSQTGSEEHPAFDPQAPTPALDAVQSADQQAAAVQQGLPSSDEVTAPEDPRLAVRAIETSDLLPVTLEEIHQPPELPPDLPPDLQRDSPPDSPPDLPRDLASLADRLEPVARTGPGASVPPSDEVPLLVQPSAAAKGPTTAAATPRARRQPGQSARGGVAYLWRHRWLLLWCLVPVVVGLVAGFGVSSFIDQHRVLRSRSERVGAPTGGSASEPAARPRAAPLLDEQDPLQVDVAARLKRARALVGRGELLRAHLLFATVLVSAPDNIEAVDGYARTQALLRTTAERGSVEGATHGPTRQLEALLRLRRAMVDRRWGVAQKALDQLPRHLLRVPRARLWAAEVARASGQLERARGIYRRLAADSAPRDLQLRVEATLGLSEVLLQRNYRTAALLWARRARRLVRPDHPAGLRRRVDQQVRRCVEAKQ